MTTTSRVTPLRIVGRIALGLAAIAGLGWAGLAIRPAPFPPYGRHGAVETTPLPGGLPAPVERFYRQIYGDRIPVLRSAVITGRATMRIGGVTMPARLRFTHEAGRGYRHYIEATVFGLPLMKVNESYLDGHELMELPFGSFEGPTYDQAGNLGMWAEMLAWLPASLLTDQRVRWEAVDDTTAWLIVPFGAAEERFLLRFDPETGMLRLAESMRHKAEGPVKTLWVNEARAYGEVGGYTVMTESALTWQDDGVPWAVFAVEEVVYNADVTAYVRAKGL
ncbi:MAG TPA: hypothetical protein PKD53_25750 [Chloroflexaceae bacterium]|nr:hypothetical protein [Chloroflexaceae bacterium]